MSDLPSPKKHKTSNWSAIWVLPLVALAIGAWLGWRAYDQAGVLIQVRFESSDGIQAKKTEVLYKGIAVGKVVALDVSEDIKGVVATIEMDKEARQYLSKGTRFWLVKPRVSLAGVTGLETLVSGVYIAVDPVKGEKEERNFTALKQPPPLSDRLPGLHLTLKADRLGSLEQGSPVFYRQIQVGQVKSFQLGDDQRTIEIKVHIEPAYADLVRKHTRFWNASGISISGGLSGFSSGAWRIPRRRLETEGWRCPWRRRRAARGGASAPGRQAPREDDWRCRRRRRWPRHPLPWRTAPLSPRTRLAPHPRALPFPPPAAARARRIRPR